MLAACAAGSWWVVGITGLLLAIGAINLINDPSRTGLFALGIGWTAWSCLMGCATYLAAVSGF